MSTQFYKLGIKEKIQETDDTVSLRFDIPSELSELFQYKAGQYLTLKFNIKGEDARRAYSMSSSPLEKHIAVTIKRVKGGLVSNYIHDVVKVGDEIEVMPPQGRFVPKLNEEHRKTYYLFGAGSGITPLMSILKTVLELEPQSSVFLYYGSRIENQIIFKAELDQLEKTYKGQLRVIHIVSQPTKVKSGGLAGMFGKKQTLWLGEKGRINRKTTASFLEKHIPPYPDTVYFICGPGNMTQTIEDVLIARGVKKKQIYFELFNSETPGDGTKKAGGANSPKNGASQAIIHLDGKVFNMEIPAGKTILDALLDKKEEPPYSCTTGSCSTCMAKVTSGKVKMDVCYALDDDEIADGYVLTCQAKPDSAELEVRFDV